MEPSNLRNDIQTHDLFKYQIRFCDLAKGEHRIDLNDLGKSLQGFSCVFAVVGTYVLNQRIPQKPADYKVEVSTDAAFYKGSVGIWALISSAQQALGDVSNIKDFFDIICAFIFSKREQKDMDKVLDYLKTRDEKDDRKDERRHEEHMEALKIIAKIVDVNVKNSIASVDYGCKKIEISSADLNEEESKLISNIDGNVKNAINKKPVPKEEISQQIDIIIYSLNKKTSRCNFYLKEQYKQHEIDNSVDLISYNGIITDPNFQVPGNSYVRAFDTDSFVTVVSKIKHNLSSDVYYISDTIQNTGDNN